jgi:hypothetical protein
MGGVGSQRLQLEWDGGATPFSLLDLESRDAISIPTAPTNLTGGLIRRSITSFFRAGFGKVLTTHWERIIYIGESKRRIRKENETQPL